MYRNQSLVIQPHCWYLKYICQDWDDMITVLTVVTVLTGQCLPSNWVSIWVKTIRQQHSSDITYSTQHSTVPSAAHQSTITLHNMQLHQVIHNSLYPIHLCVGYSTKYIFVKTIWWNGLLKAHHATVDYLWHCNVDKSVLHYSSFRMTRWEPLFYQFIITALYLPTTISTTCLSLFIMWHHQKQFCQLKVVWVFK